MIIVALEILEIKANFNLQLFVLFMSDSGFGIFIAIWIAQRLRSKKTYL